MTTKKSTTSRKPRARKGPAPDSAAPAGTAPKPSPFTRDPRLPAAGSVVQRAYRGKVHEITVREDGFEYEKATYRSLSQLARHITGAKSINGFLWLGISKPAATPKAAKGTPEQVASAAKARAARAAKVAAKKAAKASS